MGEREKSDRQLKECLENIDHANESPSKSKNEEDSLNSNLDISARIQRQQQRLFCGVNTNIREREANSIQKIANHFRERQEFSKACDILEKVLTIRKRQFLNRKRQSDHISEFENPIEDEDVD
mmetsp:Transcript_8837/g.14981  ORF Transcript_8837/g.14981 Transcript_8837/m.14981 type:complete len:123 (-) Transcript_8837:1163-1531(-)